MDRRGLIRKLRWSWVKNKPELQALTTRRYPEFVFARRPAELRDEIPVFNFHDVDESSFEAAVRYLAENGYRTLDSAELEACLLARQPLPPHSVMLTFDDGWRSLHTVAAPVLRRYGAKGVCFLIAGVMAQDRQRAPDYPGAECVITWEEARADRDVVDFQSHSMWHARVSVSWMLVDFIHPGFDFYALRVHVPLLRRDGRDDLTRQAALGTPVYEYAPRMAGHPRVYDDENLRARCVEWVERNGGAAFFDAPNWRERLSRFHREQAGGARFVAETRDDMRRAMLAELSDSRKVIERELPGSQVRAFCYPWFVGSADAVDASRDAGYTANYWGVLSGRRTNRPGDDPFRIVRLPPDYIWRLPGRGRRSLLEVLGGMFRRHAPGFARTMRG